MVHVQDLRRVIRRKPLIWDNLHANYYDGRRFFCGPYSGRPLELRSELSGLLQQPEQRAAAELRSTADAGRVRARRQSMGCAPRGTSRRWRRGYPPSNNRQSHCCRGPDSVGDCYYLPHEEGAEAVALCERARSLLARPPAEWADDVTAFREQTQRLRDFCTRMTELRERPLFHALSRRVCSSARSPPSSRFKMWTESRPRRQRAQQSALFISSGPIGAEWWPGCSSCWSSDRLRTRVHKSQQEIRRVRRFLGSPELLISRFSVRLSEPPRTD